MTDLPTTDLNQLSRIAGDALRRRDAPVARAAFERLTAARPADVGAWFGLSLACDAQGDAVGLLGALDRVLAAEPGHLPALILKADHFAKVGDDRAAVAFYRAAVSRAPPLEALPPDMRAEVQRARAMCDRYTLAFEDHLRGAVARAGFDPATSSRRFAQSLELLLGKKQVFLQAPTSFYFPELPHRQFYERSEFPWLAEVESMTAEIRRELLQVIEDDAAFQPYVRSIDTRPVAEFHDLRDNPKWSAFYLIEGGAVVESAAARCPATMAAVAKAPLSAAPGRTPSVLFSLLRAGARIPPHNGQINARLICHLPLIVPPGCGLRVGNEVRPWVEGEALIFDDSIEHEAWNESDRTRVVLLFEIWRPELTPEERNLVAATLASVGSYG